MNAYEYQQFVNDLENLSVSVAECVKQIQHRALLALAQTFARSVDNSSCLSDLPHILMTHIAMESITGMVDAFLMVSAALANPAHKDPKAVEEQRKEAVEQMKMTLQDPQALKVLLDWRRDKFDLLLRQHAETQSSLQQLLYSIASQLWTAYEVLAKDLWVATVNSHPDGLVQNILSARNDQARDKQIGIQMLAKHGFDVRERMGTLLAPKFAFDQGLSGIAKAYQAAFPNETALERIFGAPEIAYLEEVRHLIVHNAGIVDAKFVNKTKSAVAEGVPLPLDLGTVLASAGAITQSGCELILLVDRWLAANP